MATLKDVAAKANVDVSTVSRALNNTSYVHPETKARIIAAAKDLGYRPNTATRSLRRGRRKIIGYVVPRTHVALFSEILRGVDSKARELGYSVMICITDDNPQKEEACLNQLREGNVDGIILTPTGKNTRLIRDIHACGIAIVQIIRRQDHLLSSIVADNESCGYESVKYLYNLGSRTIGLINGSNLLAPYAERYIGYRRALEEFHLQEIVAASEKPTNSFSFGYECATRLLKNYPSLDAIMAAVDIQGLGVIRAVKDFGKKIPDDIKVMSMTGHTIGKMLETTMTSMEIPASEMGSAAVDMLIAEIEAPSEDKPRACHKLFRTSLTERESTVCSHASGNVHSD